MQRQDVIQLGQVNCKSVEASCFSPAFGILDAEGLLKQVSGGLTVKCGALNNDHLRFVQERLCSVRRG
ncbi:hypothetical protein C6366_14395 [Desulfonatronum sp. SC1]|nr:hypothetical protein C6366_14395 [Desulfonatronum sp. SC1]